MRAKFLSHPHDWKLQKIAVAKLLQTDASLVLCHRSLADPFDVLKLVNILETTVGGAVLHNRLRLGSTYSHQNASDLFGCCRVDVDALRIRCVTREGDEQCAGQQRRLKQ